MEEWRDIKGYEGLYQVSSTGRIKSLERIKQMNEYTFVHTVEHIVKLSVNKFGYVRCGLTKDGKVTWFNVHRLVANAFIPNIENLKYVNHKDENKKNNCVDNLEWCSSQYNNSYGTRLDRVSHSRSTPVYQVDISSGEVINRFYGMSEARRKTGVNESHISQCCTGKRKTAGGYVWRYAE